MTSANNHNNSQRCGIDLSLENPSVISVSNTIKAGYREISNRRADETGILIPKNIPCRLPAVPRIIVLGKLPDFGIDISSRVYSVRGTAPTISTMGGGERQPKILIKNNCKKDIS